MGTVPGWGLASAVAAPVLLIGGWTLAARLQREGFDPVTGTISDLAARDADHRWVMTAALAGVGAAHVTTAAALRPAPVPARLLMATGGIGTVLVAALPLPGGDQPAPAHAAAAGVALGALAAWPVIGWRRRKPGEEPPPLAFRAATAIPAGATLLASLGWFLGELSRGGPRAGLTERVAAGAQALWPLIAVLTARRRP